MTVLTDYNAFDGRHWETGSVHNYYRHGGIVAPHTDESPSEALLMGISGGIVFGYFSFAYSGYDPILALLTRNTFDPLETLFSRLGVVKKVQQTANADKGRANLLSALEDGSPAIVWADMWSLPYNGLVYDEGMWGMMPLVVYGLDEEAYIADRSAVGLRVSAENFQAARSRIKKDKHRMMLLEAPDWTMLPIAVTAGIHDTIKLFTEKPPKGSANNFGLNAYKQWVKLLTKSAGRQSWDKVFPSGIELFAGLTGIFERTTTFGQARCGADRHTFADFLAEASIILQEAALRDVSQLFRESADAWCAMNQIALPDELEILAETRRLLLERQRLFIEKGNASIERRTEISTRLKVLHEAFELSSAEISQLKNQIAVQVMVIHDIEQRAIAALSDAMG